MGYLFAALTLCFFTWHCILFVSKGNTYALQTYQFFLIHHYKSSISFHSQSPGYLAHLPRLPSIRRLHSRFLPSCLLFAPRRLASHRHGGQRGHRSSAGRRFARLAVRPPAPQMGPHVFAVHHWRRFATPRQLASASWTFRRMDLLLHRLWLL